jgi:hypothetical protein
VQVHKSAGHNVVKMKDEEGLLNMEEVQSYNINNDKVLFLTARPQMGRGKVGVYWCDHCDRVLQHEAASTRSDARYVYCC